MIDLYGWMTPNSRKIYYMLEETGLDYQIHPVNIGAGQQHEPEFLAFSPNNKTPAMIDTDGPGGKPHSVFETGAMLIYLAEKTGQFLPVDATERSSVMQWLMWQIGGMAPMLGQQGYFNNLDDKDANAHAVERFAKEAARLYGVLDKRLSVSEYVAGGEYTIADISAHPWARSHPRQGVSLDDYPNVKRWFEQINERPATQRGNKIGDSVKEASENTDGPIDPKSLV